MLSDDCCLAIAVHGLSIIMVQLFLCMLWRHMGERRQSGTHS
jgi:hypothetical protein